MYKFICIHIFRYLYVCEGFLLCAFLSTRFGIVLINMFSINLGKYELIITSLFITVTIYFLYVS